MKGAAGEISRDGRVPTSCAGVPGYFRTFLITVTLCLGDSRNEIFTHSALGGTCADTGTGRADLDQALVSEKSSELSRVTATGILYRAVLLCTLWRPAS
jgi:hypothetical protein